jgi:uncharacterized protein (TIGR00303 family)
MTFKVVKGDGEKFIELLKKRVVFVLVAGNTETAEIPGITVAGANPQLVKYTPSADAELLYYGKCLSIDDIPATPDGKPTPALISYTSLRLTGIPFFVVDSGMMVKPKIPFITLSAPVGKNIEVEDAMSIGDAVSVVESGKMLGRQLSRIADCLMIGETIPAGTTTAGAVLKALNLNPAVSSSMPENPIDLKLRVIDKAVKRLESNDVLEILAKVGDPVLAGIVGISLGSECPVVLAGGTQMVAAANLISRAGECEAAIATTVYVASDPNTDLSLSPYPVMVSDPGLGESRYPGLRAYSEGFVKEGVGAGGLALLVYARGFSKKELLREIEEDYRVVVKPYED